MPPVIAENWLLMAALPIAGWVIYRLRTFFKNVSGSVQLGRLTLTIKKR
ncbi:hypothetical protein AB0L05_15765 [Nonomuraea pusilla]|nr:hypothetical protein [Nonomuraea pusilla]